MLIGIVGFIGSGKGAASDILVKDYSYTKVSFADSLKDAASNIFGWSRHLLEGDTIESRDFRETIDSFWSSKFGYDVSPRKVLQTLGTESCRDIFHENIWIFSVEKKIEAFQDVVIPDVRFPNEIDFIKSKGGIVIRVVRGKDPEWYDTAYRHNTEGLFEMYRKYPDIHFSEWAWIGQKFNHVIENEGTLEKLSQDIKNILQSHKVSSIIRKSSMINK